MVERRRAIFEQARGIIEEKGWAGLTMRELARRASVSVGGLYLEFASKEAILGDDILAQQAEVRSASRGTGRHFGDEWLRFVDLWFQRMAAHPELYRRIFQLFTTFTPTDVQRATEARLLKSGAESLRAAQVAGEIEAWVDIEALGCSLFFMHMGHYIRWGQKRMTLDELYRQLVHSTCYLLAGIARPDIAADIREHAKEK